MAVPKLDKKIVKKRVKKFKRPHNDWKICVKENWRRPKGIDSHVRRKFKGVTLMPNIGYASDKKTLHYSPNGFKKFVVQNAKELEVLMMHNSAKMIYSTESKAFKAYLVIINVAPASSYTDFENVAKLQRKAFEEIAQIGLEQLVRVMVAKAVKRPYLCLMAADKDESTICAYITMVVVKNEYRRRGVVSKLLREAMLIVKNKGMRRAVLHVEESNIGAISCYNKEGFVQSTWPHGAA